MISCIADPETMNTQVKEKIRDWIVKVTKGEIVSWPSYPCAIWVDGTPRNIKNGTWALYNTEVYVGNDGSNSPIKEAPGIVLAISYFFGLYNDEELQTLILDFLAKVVTRSIKPFSRGFIYTLSGRSLDAVAINPDEGKMAARYKIAEEENEHDEWRQYGTGEIVDVSGTGWTSFQLITPR